MSATTFKLGDITFTDPMEVPAQLTDVGGKQIIAIHEFPGGIKTAQVMGPLPKTIKFSGKLIGATAMSRHFQLKALADDGDEITLVFDELNFDGVVDDYIATVLSINEIEYEIHFEPLQDNNVGNTMAAMPPTAADFLAQANDAFTQQVQDPASQYQFADPIPTNATNLSNAVQNTLTQNGFSLNGLSQQTVNNLVAQVGSLRSLLAPLMDSTDSAESSAAGEADASLALMENALTQGLPPMANIDVTNPDLVALSSAYYGDPDYWEYIAAANTMPDGSQIVDEVPTGDFSLVIPSLQGIAA